jgi:transcription elongation GreA/GreB family factor
VTPPLPSTRAELMTLHAAARRRRANAAHDSPDYRAACEEIARIEVRISEIERAHLPGPKG